MPRRSHSEMVDSLVNIATEAVRFRSLESVIYYRIPCGEGHQAVPVHSDIGRTWLLRQYTEICHQPPSRAALAEAIPTIVALSLTGEGRDCPLRISYEMKATRAAPPPSTSTAAPAAKPSRSPPPDTASLMSTRPISAPCFTRRSCPLPKFPPRAASRPSPGCARC